MQDSYDYKAFISYSHKDVKWARWVQRALESYVVPKRLVGKVTPRGVVGPHLRPVFRDRDEFSSESDLSAAVTTALTQSAVLIVVCSPDSARSRWVNEEVLTFKRLGRAEAIITLIVGGEPNASTVHGHASEECFCEALRYRLNVAGDLSNEPVEPIAADLRPGGDGKRQALRKLVAPMLGIKLDELVRRDLNRRLQRMAWVAAGSTVGMAVTLSLAILAYLSSQDAERRRNQAEELLSFMVGDLRRSLEPIGRLDLLQQVSDEAMTYFASTQPSDLTDSGLSKHAKVLTQIGNIRLAQRRFDEALSSFGDAYERSASLAARNPGDGNFLFERAQAEFWLGYVFWRHGQLDRAQLWLEAYRDTSLELVGIDPLNDMWVNEVVSGHHNLAVIALDRADLAAADRGFRDELRTLEEMALRQPQDATLIDQRAIAESWLGTTSVRRGMLLEAAAHFKSSTAHRTVLNAKDTNNIIAQSRLGQALLFEANVYAILGQLPEARKVLERAFNLLAAAIQRDPSNHEWRRMYALTFLHTGKLHLAEGNLDAAGRDLQTAVDEVSPLVKADDTELDGGRMLADARRLLAEVHWAQGDLAKASDFVAQARQGLADLYDSAVSDRRLVGAFADALLISAQVDEEGGKQLTANEYLQHAETILEGVVEDSRYYRILDPWARLMILRGESEEAARVVAMLASAGYQPLRPWPRSR